MNYTFTPWGTLNSVEQENTFLNSKWPLSKNYTFLTYFLCCLFFLLAGVFGDFQRTFLMGSAHELLILRVLLLIISVVFFFCCRGSDHRPKYLSLWLDSMKLLSTIIIFFLTYWTGGSSLTLLPGIMMMVICFYMVLPGRISSTNICSISLLAIFIFLQDPELTYGLGLHRYRIFMLTVIIVLLYFFKAKQDRWERTEYMSKKELDSLSQTKNKLLATIGHDIRGPLAIIQSRADISLLNLESRNYESVMNSQKMIIKTTSKLDHLLSDIVNWAISDLKEGVSFKEEQCITKTVDDAVEFVIELANHKSIIISKKLQPYPYLHEPRMVATCFRNVLTNAIKFNPSHSEVLIRGEVDDDFYHIEFVDQGPGLSEDVVDRIKKGLIDSTQLGSEGEKGSGLGLKLVKNIVEGHNGELNIYPNTNRGSIFRISLPITKEESDA